MTSRRNVVLGIAGGLLLPSLALATESGIVKGRHGGPNMIKGDPPKLDFGKGLLIPMNKAIFKTLWEGEDRWITYATPSPTNKSLPWVGPKTPLSAR